MSQAGIFQKPSRLRKTSVLRELARETRLHPADFVAPLFFKLGRGTEKVDSMPGIEKMGEDALCREAEKLTQVGVKAVLLFGTPREKDAAGSEAYQEKSPFHRAIRKIKETSDITVITDICLCAYTDHGHCGILRGSESKRPAVIEEAKTLEALAKIALSHAAVGADVVAPSAMTDGQVRAIRSGLDANGFPGTAIMSYSSKYASSFYGPFRDIAGTQPSFGDRKTYQMDPANKREAVREALLDVEEGADMVMVKPALCYLDVISAVRGEVKVPVAAYNVSGEYAMVKAAAGKGWLDESSAAMEILTSIKRAGADVIITYWAREACHWLKK